MRLTIKGSNRKVIALYKELRLRVKRDNLDMVISKSKAEEEADVADEKEAAEAIKRSKAAKQAAIDLEIKKAKEANAKVEAEIVANLKAKAIIRDKKEAETRATLKAKAEKKAALKAEEEKREKAIAYVMDKMDEEVIKKPTPKKGTSKSKS